MKAKPKSVDAPDRDMINAIVSQLTDLGTYRASHERANPFEKVFGPFAKMGYTLYTQDRRSEFANALFQMWARNYEAFAGMAEYAGIFEKIEHRHVFINLSPSDVDGLFLNMSQLVEQCSYLPQTRLLKALKRVTAELGRAYLVFKVEYECEFPNSRAPF